MCRSLSAPHPGRVFCLLVGFAPALSAQAGPPVAAVELLNTTKQGGWTVADVVVPVPRGKAFTAPNLVTAGGRLCQTEPMGARWPDGSLRCIHVDVPVYVRAGERRTEMLSLWTGILRPHTPALIVRQRLPQLRVWFYARGQYLLFTNPVLVEKGPLVHVYRSRVRAKNSCIWAELRTLVYHDVPHVRFYLQWGNSNPVRRELHEDPGEVSLAVRGADVVVDEEAAKIRQRRPPTSGGGVDLSLHSEGYLADGQAQCFEGRFVFAGAMPPRVRAIAHGWVSSNAFGPFGELLPEAKVDAARWQKRIAADAIGQRKDPWAAPLHGCNPDPSNTGDQADFGVVVMREDVLGADPSRLESIARSVYQEWCRPTHFRELDLRPVTLKNHPNLITLAGRPHWPAGPRIDTLGKPRRYLDAKKIAADPKGRPFRGHDAEHLSLNYLCAFALTTGDRLARLECEHMTELWLAEFTHNSGTFNDPAGSARAVGRSLQAGCWLWLVTGRNDLAVRIAQRVGAVRAQLSKPRNPVTAALPYVLTPRWSRKLGYYWPAWEEAIAATGLAAVHALFQWQEAGVLAATLSDNIVRHGIGFASPGWRVGYQLPFVTSLGVPYVSLLDPWFGQMQAAGSGLTLWTLPAIILAARYSQDPATRWLAGRMFGDLMADPRFAGKERIVDWMVVVPRHLGG